MRSSREIKSDAALIMKQNLRSILLISLGYLAVSFILSLLYGELSGMSAWVKQYTDMMTKMMETGEFTEVPFPQVKRTASVLAFLIYCVTFILAGGYRGYHLMRARGETAGFMDIMPKGMFLFRVLCIQLFTTFLTAVGAMLFVVPGVIAALSYSQAVYIMFDNPEMSALGCMRESRRMMRGQKMRLFKLELSFLGWLILAEMMAVTIFPVLNIWLDPYMGISMASFYNEIAARSAE